MEGKVMKKRLLFIALLLAAVTVLCACSSDTTTAGSAGQVQQASGQVSPMEQTAAVQEQAQAAASQTLPDSYDPASEEDGTIAPVAANGSKVYAGATPILIEPVDKPTATPRPELTFTYGEYVASKLGLRFSSAMGYDINENISGKYILTEPAAAVKDNYPCTITLEISGVSKAYTVNDVKTSLSQYLSNEGLQYDKWEVMTAAKKTLMNGQGYYNNYRGVLADGTIVRGRVHMAIIGEGQLLTLHVSCPGWYNSSYMKLYDQIHGTIKPIQAQ